MYSSAEKILSILSIDRKDKGLEGIIYLIAIGIPFIISLGIRKLIFEEMNVVALIASIVKSQPMIACSVETFLFI